MKKAIVLFALLILVLVLAPTVFADEAETCHWDTGLEFGQHHAEMAQLGMFGPGHNPGQHHQGYSICVP